MSAEPLTDAEIEDLAALTARDLSGVCVHDHAAIVFAAELEQLRQTVRAMLASRPQRYSGGARAYNDAIATLQVLVQEETP